MTDLATFLDDHTLQVGSVQFHCDLRTTLAPPGMLPVMKPRRLVELLLGFLDQVRPSVIVELGIKRGGSTALLHAAARPELLLAFELEPEVPPLLAQYIEERGVGDVVRPHVGVDQADRGRLAAILAEELRGRPVDLVIDDASHLLDETRASFEVLFPLLRAGGIFVIEDWQADRLVSDAIAARVDEPDGAVRARLSAELEGTGWTPEDGASLPGRTGSLLQLPFELALARSARADVIRSVTIMDHWIVVERGEDPADPATFSLAELVGTVSHLLPVR
jgi:predicted O-methyltransferase YrrM